MSTTDWMGGRRPLADEAAEHARTAAYWSWLGEHACGVVDAALYAAYADGGGRWVRLATPADADWEALHMRHSIGHSWERYSAYGDIYSLRSPDGLPQATVLVSDGYVVHAREHENARLSPLHQAELEAFAQSHGWTIKPDHFAFDVLRDDGAPNTQLTYLLRDGAGHKTFGSATFAGRLDDGHIAELAAGLPAGCDFRPSWIGAPDLAGQEGLHVLTSLRDVPDAPTSGLDASEACDAMLCGAAQEHIPGTTPTAIRP